jgi:hypothetical protein
VKIKKKLFLSHTCAATHRCCFRDEFAANRYVGALSYAMSMIKLRGVRHRKGKKLNKREIAEIKALKELGNSNYAIEKRTGITHGTIATYLANQEAYNNPKIKELVARVKENEISDLVVLNLKAKDRLHKIIPSANVIEALAVMDRSFQQTRLLEGKSTQNIASLTQIVKSANPELED